MGGDSKTQRRRIRAKSLPEKAAEGGQDEGRHHRESASPKEDPRR